MTLGDLIKTIRQEEGITQEQLAIKINKTKSYVSKVEKQNFIPNNEIIKDIALALNIAEECFEEGGSITGASSNKALLASYVQCSHQERYELIKKICANIINFDFQNVDKKIINNNDLIRDIESLIKNRIEFYSRK